MQVRFALRDIASHLRPSTNVDLLLTILPFIGTLIPCSLFGFIITPVHLCQILIKTLTGRKQSFNFEPEDQISAVKQQLQEKEGIQVDQIRLIYAGKQLADDKTLSFYNVVAGGTIHMVLQLRGGR